LKKKEPLITVVTVVYNGAASISRCITSVRNQTYKNVEYIVIDGNSKDKTLEIVNRNADFISRIISEDDKGIYDAMNKGIQLAKGDVLAFLNADDVYANKRVLEWVAEAFAAQSEMDVVYGNLHLLKHTKKIDRTWISGKFYHWKLLTGWAPPHPCFFCKTELVRRAKGFNRRYSIAADYDLMLRILSKKRTKAAYIPKFLVNMRSGGISNANIRAIARANRQCYMSARRRYGVLRTSLMIFLKLCRKIIMKIKSL